MSSIKTYLINDGGEIKLKQHQTNDQFVLKNTLEEKRMQRKMAQQKRDNNQNNLNQDLKNLMGKNIVNYVPEKKVNIMEVINYPKQNKMVEYEVKKTNYYEKPEKIQKVERQIESATKIKDPNLLEEKQRRFFHKICKIIGIHGQPHGKVIPFEKLDDPYVIKELYEMQQMMKEVFPSSKLTALHKNAQKKQSFPGVNMVRQIFKEMGYRLKPVTYSEGYLGTKKLIRREYHILKL